MQSRVALPATVRHIGNPMRRAIGMMMSVCCMPNAHPARST
jgi:hypothetical protein